MDGQFKRIFEKKETSKNIYIHLTSRNEYMPDI